MKSLVIADSRGAHMETLLNNTADIGNIHVSVNPGSGLTRSAERTKQWIVNNKPDLIIIMSGICDITSKDNISKTIRLKYNTVAEVTETVMRSIRQTYDLIQHIGEFTVSFSTITGLELADTNNKDRRKMTDNEYRHHSTHTKLTHPQQKTLDEAVIEINRRITAFNETNNTPTTWMAEIVHPYLRGRHRHYYSRLADGCHPSNNTRRRWAHQIVRTIRKMAEHQQQQRR